MTEYELRFPWPWHLPEGIARAVVIGVIFAMVTGIGVIVWNSNQALTGIHQLQGTAAGQAVRDAAAVKKQIVDAQYRIDGLNAQIGVLEGQASSNTATIALLVADVDNLARALQADINQLIALGQRPAAGQPVTSRTTTTTSTTVPPRASPVVISPNRGCPVQFFGSCLSGQTPTTTTTTTSPRVVATGTGFGCGPALDYLQTHAAPGFTFGCAPHSAEGHYGFTCVNHPPECGAGNPVGPKHIQIACPDKTVYYNEAHNSYVLTGQASGIDPYGQKPTVGYATCNALS